MTIDPKQDAWNAGDSYDAFMGRWSRKIATRFLEWIDPGEPLDWLDVGCGTGALSSSILSDCDPRSLTGIEQSEGFVATARHAISDRRATFESGDAQDLPLDDDNFDIATSALVLNFVPDIPKALSEMRRVTRSGGTVAFYVWDYPGGGLEFVRSFWQAAIALNPVAEKYGVANRFPFCTEAGLTELMENAGFASVESRPIVEPTIFKDFNDYWRPFTLGTGPAPSYCSGLSADEREALRQKLQHDLPKACDGFIHLSARAWAIRSTSI